MVATTPPVLVVLSNADAIPVIPSDVEVAADSSVLPVKLLVPENVLLLAKSVEEAAVMVMSAEPLKDTPLIARAVWRVVAVPALPETLPVIV